MQCWWCRTEQGISDKNRLKLARGEINSSKGLEGLCAGKERKGPSACSRVRVQPKDGPGEGGQEKPESMETAGHGGPQGEFSHRIRGLSRQWRKWKGDGICCWLHNDWIPTSLGRVRSHSPGGQGHPKGTVLGWLSGFQTLTWCAAFQDPHVNARAFTESSWAEIWRFVLGSWA